MYILPVHTFPTTFTSWTKLDLSVLDNAEFAESPQSGQSTSMQHLTVVACIGTSDAPVSPLVIFRGDCNDGQESWTAARDFNGAEMVACVTKSG